MRSNCQELPGEGVYNHVFELYNDFEEVTDRIFWDDSGLKYVHHYPAERSAEVLEILEDGTSFSYCTIGDDISTELGTVSLHGFSLDQMLEDLQTASATAVVDLEDTSQFFQDRIDSSGEDTQFDYRVILSDSVKVLRKVVEYCRESVPTDVYMEF